MASIIKITDAPETFGGHLMALNVKFAYDWGDFYILSTGNIVKFTEFCLRNGIDLGDNAKLEVVDKYSFTY